MRMRWVFLLLILSACISDSSISDMGQVSSIDTSSNVGEKQIISAQQITSEKDFSKLSESELKTLFETEESKITKIELFELQPMENKLAVIVNKHDWKTAGPLLEESLRNWLKIRPYWVKILTMAKPYENEWGISNKMSIGALEGYIRDRDDLYFAKFGERAAIVRSENSPPYEQVTVPMFGLSAKLAKTNKEEGFESLNNFLNLVDSKDKNEEVEIMEREGRQQFIEEFNKATYTFDKTMQYIAKMGGPCGMLAEQCIKLNDCNPYEEAKAVNLC